MILMINTMKMRLIFPFVLLIYSLICQADGGKDSYIFRKVDYQQGLSNSAVLCLFQDNTGLMWFGTYDGVNCYDGRSMEVFRSDFSAPKALSNNVIILFSRRIIIVCGFLPIWGSIVFHRIHGKLSDIMTLQMIIIYIPILKETHGW